MVYIFDIPLIVFIKSKLLNVCCFSTFFFFFFNSRIPKPDYEQSLFLLAVASETHETQNDQVRDGRLYILFIFFFFCPPPSGQSLKGFLRYEIQ